MAVRKQSMAQAADAELREGAGRAAEHAWRRGATRHSPAQRQQLRAAIRAARREHLRRSLEALVQVFVWVSCALLLTSVVIHALHPDEVGGLLEWVTLAAEPLARPFAVRHSVRFRSQAGFAGFRSKGCFELSLQLQQYTLCCLFGHQG